MSAAASHKNVFLIGDPQLVAEFGTFAHSAGFTINYRTVSKNALFPPSWRPISSIPRNVTVAAELTNGDIDRKRKNLQLLDRSLREPAPILTSSVAVTVTEQASWIKHPGRLIGMSAFPTLLPGRLIELAPSLRTSAQTVKLATDFFADCRKEVSVVQDRIGMVMPRILCMLINEAFFALGEQIASPKDIDNAMKFGTNYPRGPVEWANSIGLRNVFSILKALQADLNEERYRIAPLLRQLALSVTDP